MGNEELQQYKRFNQLFIINWQIKSNIHSSLILVGLLIDVGFYYGS